MQTKGYQLLYGKPDFGEVCIHHFLGRADYLWSDYLKEDTLHVVFNLSSYLIIFDNNVRLNSIPGTLTMWHRGKNTAPHIGQVNPNSEGGEIGAVDLEYEALVISLPFRWLAKTFGSQRQALHPAMQRILDQSVNSIELGRLRAMLISEINLARELITPPVLKPAQVFWYAAKVMEVVTLQLFTNTNTHNNTAYCNQVKSANQRRIALAIDWLQSHLDEPLDLKGLSAHLGCTPQYISKVFSEQTGNTLKLTLRKLRIEKAAKLLSDGDYNVTEAAVEVGYNSLSHFTKAFVLEKGVKPSQYV